MRMLQSRRSAFAAAGAMLALALGAGTANGQPASYEYVVKYVCGIPAPTAAVPKPPVARGHYHTAINVQNLTSDAELSFRKMFVVALPGEKQGGFISQWHTAKLKIREAFEIDCPDILDKVHAPNTPVPTFAKGFVYIVSTYPLEVIAVYTAAAVPNGSVVTMAVERVPRRQP
jgi:hypothetical protein